MLPAAKTYDDLITAFRWRIPQRYNIGYDACDKWADGSGRLALIHLGQDGAERHFSFDVMAQLSNRLANALVAKGILPGARIAVLLPQAPETAIAHLAAYKMGAIAIPLFALFGPDALEFRLKDSGAWVLVTDRAGAEKIAPLRDKLGDLRLILTIDGATPLSEDFHSLVAQASDRFQIADTGPDDPALIIYTSGTTGPPKGALHGHRVLLGHLPGVEMPQDFFPQVGDRIWTPADWAWIGGLLDVLLPAWHHGVAVVSHRFAKFDPEAAFDLMARQGVRNAFLPPTALKMMREVKTPQERFSYKLRSIGSGGETLGAELLDWGREVFGLTVNEFYGQTECNLIVSNAATLMPAKPGAMGRPVAGHQVAVIDSHGQAVATGEIGQVAVKAPDPVMFLGYWNQPEATAAKFIGPWLLTGDTARRDEEGYLWFVGRNDDVISSGGYRIGPGEVEDCLLTHPAVAMSGVIGVPDPIRGEAVKAYVVLRAGEEPSPALAESIKAHVKTRLAAHEYPREVAFIKELPMTTTGKIMRRELKRLHREGR